LFRNDVIQNLELTFCGRMTAKPVETTRFSFGFFMYKKERRLGRTVDKIISPFFTNRFALPGAYFNSISCGFSATPVPMEEISHRKFIKGKILSNRLWIYGSYIF